MPPDADAVRVMLFPTSVGFWELDIETDGSEFTVSVMVFDVTEYPALSTYTTKMEYVPAEKEVLYDDPVPIWSEVDPEYHVYDPPPEPPETEEEN